MCSGLVITFRACGTILCMAFAIEFIYGCICAELPTTNTTPAYTMLTNFDPDVRLRLKMIFLSRLVEQKNRSWVYQTRFVAYSSFVICCSCAGKSQFNKISIQTWKLFALLNNFDHRIFRCSKISRIDLVGCWMQAKKCKKQKLLIPHACINGTLQVISDS